MAVITIFQLVFMSVMARLLNPADFGLVAIANVSLRFFTYFAQMGVGPALIQKPTLQDGDIESAMTLSLGVSSSFFILVIATAGLFENFFEIESLAPVMRVLALNFVILGFSSVSLGLIKRNKQFKMLALIETSSYVVGYGLIGLTSAYLDAGVWALVAAFISQTLTSAIISYSITRHPVSLRHTKEHRRHFIGYGGRYSIIGFVEFLTANVDSLIVGKLMGSSVAGYYNRSLLLANIPVQNPTKVLTQSLFPILSSMSDEHDKQSISLQLGILLVGCYAFAVSAGILVAAPDIVRVLLGDKWIESVPILQVLSLSVGPIYVSNVMGVTLDSMAKLTAKLHVQVIVLVLLLLLLATVAPSGNVTSVAMAAVISFWARLFLMGFAVIRILKIPLVNIVKMLSCIVLVSVAAGVFVLFASKAVFVSNNDVIRLLGEVIFGVFGFIVGLILARFVVNRYEPVVYLASRMPRIAKYLGR